MARMVNIFKRGDVIMEDPLIQSILRTILVLFLILV